MHSHALIMITVVEDNKNIMSVLFLLCTNVFHICVVFCCRSFPSGSALLTQFVTETVDRYVPRGYLFH